MKGKRQKDKRVEGEGERVEGFQVKGGVEGFQVKANGGGEQKCDSWEEKDEHGLAKVRGRRGTTGKSV